MTKLMALLLAFLFTGCGSPSAEIPAEDTAQAVQNEDINENREDTKESGSVKTAVVYFSATGTTAEVAKMVAEAARADLFEIVPEEAYTSEDLRYTDDSCRANREMNDASARPAIKEDLSGVPAYDVVYLGYPIWWGTAPRIIQTFLESYDISGAEVYVFCTSGGSGIEQSIEDLRELYPDAGIISGKRLNGASETDIQEWIGSLRS